MSETIQSNQLAWKRVQVIANALQIEKEYGCEFSSYAILLLNNLQTIVKQQIELNAGVKHC